MIFPGIAKSRAYFLIHLGDKVLVPSIFHLSRIVLLDPFPSALRVISNFIALTFVAFYSIFGIMWNGEQGISNASCA